MFLGALMGALAGGVSGYLVGQGEMESEPELEARVAELERALRETHTHLERMGRSMEDMHENMEEMDPFHPWMPEGHPWQEMMPFDPESGILGAVITQVVPGTAADEAGLQAGDIILAVENERITPDYRLPDILAEYEPGDRVGLTLLREGQTEEVRVRLGTHPENPERAYLGVSIMHIGPQGEWDR
jgi:C-terminal processing protease CtpA/Prc